MAVCKQCKNPGELGDFYMSPRGRPVSKCKFCILGNRKDRGVPEQKRQWHLKTYGMTPEAHEALLASQGGACGVCRAPEPGGRGRWHVDHDHKTGKVRGLLCARCNPMLGFSKDSPEILRQGAEYLERFARSTTGE